MNNLQVVKNAVFGASLALAGAQPSVALAEHVECVFPKHSSQVLPRKLELDIQDGSLRVIVRDSFQKSYGGKRAFGEFRREVKERELYTWTLDGVPRTVLIKLDRREYARNFLYSLWLDVKRDQATLSVIVPIIGTGTDPLKARVTGKCSSV